VDHSEHLYDNVNDPFQQRNLASGASESDLLEDYRNRLRSRMSELSDTFEPCTWYENVWTEDRNIVQGARGGAHDLDFLGSMLTTHFPDDAMERSVDD
jgi:hypothetical protein